MIMPYIWQSPEYPCITISQLPLTLSYASSIHKQQGTTIDIARMSLGYNIFEDSQIYVALSRITSLDGLYLDSFHAQKITVNKKAKEFYEKFTIV
jgi:ATP-dependent DNA helicase PIF1